MKRMAVSLVLIAAAFTAWPAQPPAAQPTVGGSSGRCDLVAMPALPPDADRAPPAARPGYEWMPGHYRCGRGWEYVPGHWRRPGAATDATAFVTRQGGRLVARPGYRFQRTGPNSAVIARMAGGGGATATGIRGTYSCNCQCPRNVPRCSVSGSCTVNVTDSGISCAQGSCNSFCNFEFTVGGTVIAAGRSGANCQPGAVAGAARREPGGRG